MVAVRINGEQSSINANGLPRMADLIELIKSSIDPEHMITAILVDGRDLEDGDWTASLNQYETSIVEIETGTPASFVADRLDKAAEIVRECYMLFREARKCFQLSKLEEGNRFLIEATNTLQAFFEWYATILELCPEADREKISINDLVTDISATCKKICQQQLYQSWWALGESLEKELEPQIDQLEDFCRKFKQQV